MTLPNFLIIGAPRAGLGAVTKLLGMHPDVCMCAEDQPNFFSVENVYAKGQGWYESLFAHYKGQPAVGEASSSYSRTAIFPNAVSRIVKHLPNVRIVYIVRNPLERLEAGYLRFLEEMPAEAVKPGINAMVKEIRHLMGSSLYFVHLTQYRKVIPAERMLVLFYEELRTKPGEEFGKLLKFAGVPRERAGEVEEARIVQELEAERAAEGALRSKFPISWDAKVKGAVVEAMKAEAEKLMIACQKPLDFWKMG